MLKNRMKKVIFFCIIIVILIIGLVFIIQGNKKDRLLDLYKKLNNHKQYSFSIEKNDADYEYKLVISKKNDYFCIDMYGDEHTSTIKKDGYVYYVIHGEQEYYSMYDNDDTDVNIVENALNKIKDNPYNNGKEKINGKTYYYEEYQDSLDFLMKLNVNEEDAVKTRFYFEGNNIAYIKNICGNSEELLKIQCKLKADNKSFEIPSNYAEK